MTAPRVVAFDISAFTGAEYAEGETILRIRPAVTAVVDGEIIPATWTDFVPDALGQGTIALLPGDGASPEFDYMGQIWRRSDGAYPYEVLDLPNFRVPTTGAEPLSLGALIAGGIPPAVTSYWRSITQEEYDAAADLVAAAVAAAGEASTAADLVSSFAVLTANTPSDLQLVTPEALAVGDFVSVLSNSKSYKRVTTGGDLNFTGAGGVMLLTQGRIDFFNFLTGYTEAERLSIRAGTYMGDLAAPWAAFRAALQAVATAGGRPHGFIPECTIRTSASPNFGMMFLRLETQGNVRVINTGGLPGIRFDGAPDVLGVPTGLGPTGYGLVGLDVDPIEASTTTGNIGYDVIWCHKSSFRRPTSNGGIVAGVAMRGCVSSKFDSAQASDRNTLSWLSSAPPFAGIWVTSYAAYVSDLAATIDAPNSWCTLIDPVGEYATDACILMENCYGMNIYGGASQGGGYGAASGLGAGRGLVLTSQCRWAKIYGHDSEYNVSDDIWLLGSENTLWGTDTQDTFRIEGAAAFGNRVHGGKHKLITLDAATNYNLVSAAAETLTDLGVGNRIVDCPKKVGDTSISGWHDDWTAYTPALAPAAGSFTAATATGKYRKVGKTVHFEATATITTNGTASGAVVLGLPFVALSAFNPTGVERAIANSLVGADVTAGTANMVIKLSGGTYPGGDGRVIRISGTYEAA